MAMLAISFMTAAKRRGPKSFLICLKSRFEVLALNAASNIRSIRPSTNSSDACALRNALAHASNCLAMSSKTGSQH